MWRAGRPRSCVSPGGESMLVDTGWGGFNRRDAERIAAAAKKAGVKRIDYLVITHFHTDHVGRRRAACREAADPQFRRPWDERGDGQAGGDPVQVLRRAARQGQAHPGEAGRHHSRSRTWTCAWSRPAGQTLAAPLAGAGQPEPGMRQFQEAGCRQRRERAVGRTASCSSAISAWPTSAT